MGEPDEDLEFNPYAPPKTRVLERTKTMVLPGWLVLLFSMVSLYLVVPFVPSGWSIGMEGDEINAIFYGVPSAIATLLFGIRNLLLQRHVATSLIGTLITLFSVLWGGVGFAGIFNA